MKPDNWNEGTILPDNLSSVYWDDLAAAKTQTEPKAKESKVFILLRPPLYSVHTAIHSSTDTQTRLTTPPVYPCSTGDCDDIGRRSLGWLRAATSYFPQSDTSSCGGNKHFNAVVEADYMATDPWALTRLGVSRYRSSWTMLQLCKCVSVYFLLQCK